MGVKVKQESLFGTGVLATTYADDYTFKGQHFLINARETLALSGTKTFLIDLSAVKTANLAVVFEPLSLKSESTTVSMKLYEGTNYTGGTAQTIYNINRASSITAKTVIALAPDVPETDPTKGTKIREHVAFANAQGANANPAAVEAININILDTSKNYLLEIVNEEATATDTEWNISFFEV